LPTLRDIVTIKTRNLNEAGKSQITIFANPVLRSSENPGLTRSEDNRWAGLPGTKEEGTQIQKIFPQALLLTENNFTIENFTARARVSKIMHLATHVYYEKSGIPQGKDRSEAGIIFSGADKYLNSKLNPSILTAKDIASMDLSDISLLAISGCESGVSDGKFTETWSGLQRALFVAGAKSALTSAWKVDDRATAEFMSRFYQHVRDGDDLDTALVNVQKEFKAGIPGRPEWEAPYYWAAWQLVGDWRQIKGL
jgi:CHAT domain-containing protein